MPILKNIRILPVLSIIVIYIHQCNRLRGTKTSLMNYVLQPSERLIQVLLLGI